MKFFEDIRVGDRNEFGSHTFSGEEIKAFARKYDPQLFHVDEEAAAKSHFGALCASGFHTACMWMKLATAYRQQEEKAQRQVGTPIPRHGPSPGYRDLKWPRPVYVGDTISFAGEVVEARAIRTRPNWGIVSSMSTGTNQNGDLVISFVGSIFVERRAPLTA